MISYRRVQKEKESDELLYTVLVARYGPQSAVSASGLKIKEFYRSSTRFYTVRHNKSGMYYKTNNTEFKRIIWNLTLTNFYSELTSSSSQNFHKNTDFVTAPEKFQSPNFYLPTLSNSTNYKLPPQQWNGEQSLFTRKSRRVFVENYCEIEKYRLFLQKCTREWEPSLISIALS